MEVLYQLSYFGNHFLSGSTMWSVFFLQKSHTTSGLTMEVLYQLSYVGLIRIRHMVIRYLLFVVHLFNVS